MIVDIGEKLHIIHRRLFDEDIHRHFVGRVEACDGPVVRIAGYLFAMDSRTNLFKRRDLLRTRILSLASGKMIINVLPATIDIEKITYQPKAGGGFQVTDGSDWQIEISHL